MPHKTPLISQRVTTSAGTGRVLVRYRTSRKAGPTSCAPLTAYRRGASIARVIESSAVCAVRSPIKLPPGSAYEDTHRLSNELREIMGLLGHASLTTTQRGTCPGRANGCWRSQLHAHDTAWQILTAVTSGVSAPEDFRERFKADG